MQKEANHWIGQRSASCQPGKACTTAKAKQRLPLIPKTKAPKIIIVVLKTHNHSTVSLLSSPLVTASLSLLLPLVLSSVAAPPRPLSLSSLLLLVLIPT